jgi:hypothetical protein
MRRPAVVALQLSLFSFYWAGCAGLPRADVGSEESAQQCSSPISGQHWSPLVRENQFESRYVVPPTGLTNQGVEALAGDYDIVLVRTDRGGRSRQRSVTGSLALGVADSMRRFLRYDDGTRRPSAGIERPLWGNLSVDFGALGLYSLRYRQSLDGPTVPIVSTYDSTSSSLEFVVGANSGQFDTGVDLFTFKTDSSRFTGWWVEGAPPNSGMQVEGYFCAYRISHALGR